MNNDFVYDAETFPNVFTLTIEHVEAPFKWVFEISDCRNDSAEIVNFIMYLRSINARMVGFNNIGFDYPILHMLMQMRHSDAQTLYKKAMAIISTQDENRWAHQVKPSDRIVEQIDLFLVHHFDNVARSTSLKVLEFNMKSDTIEDLPFQLGSTLTQSQIEILKQYNAHDVKETKKFLHISKDMLTFREKLSALYQRDFMNHNDTKIGKDYFVMELEKAGVQCYEFGINGRTPKQTIRPIIHLNDVILPWIEFKTPELIRVHDWLKNQTITETKAVFKDLSARVNGFEFIFGLGGIHGSVESQIIESNDEQVILDFDVSSYYPNLAIKNRFYPQHLTEKFCDIYQHLYEQRKSHAKGSAENAMLKLALNGVYGDSNNPYSVFYDPAFTMSITLNGQLLLCVLAELLINIDCKMIQINTDGLTILTTRKNVESVRLIASKWEQLTQLTLEESEYKRMFIRDVNNYIAEYTNGKVKRKGAYEYDLEWHQNHSALVIPKVAERVLLTNQSIEECIKSDFDTYDFMLRAKVPRNSYLTIERDGETKRLPNTTRYYIAENGGHLFKRMPPLKGKTEWRKIAVESGWGVQPCNDLNNYEKLPIDYSYYINEVEKLVLGLA